MLSINALEVKNNKESFEKPVKDISL